MNASLAKLLANVRRYRVQVRDVAFALFALVAAVLLGNAAHRRVAPLRTEQRRLESDRAEIANFRSRFRLAPGAQDARGPDDTLALGVSRDTRVSLADTIASRAEGLGLRDVKVRFTSSDSASPPTHPELASEGAAISLADYGLSIDCGGDLAAILSLVRQLPPSVVVQRLSAVRGARGGEYHLSLAVFENAKNSGPGANQHG